MDTTIKSNKSLSKSSSFAYYPFLREKENVHFMRYKNGCEGATRERSCRCPYENKGIPAQIPDDESRSTGQASTTSSLEHREGVETDEENRQRIISIQLSSFTN